MKKLIYPVIAMTFLTSAALAGQIGSGGVRSIANNGSIAGNPSYLITCNSGSDRIVIRKGNQWTDGSGATFSDRLWSLDLNGFAAKMCE